MVGGWSSQSFVTGLPFTYRFEPSSRRGREGERGRERERGREGERRRERGRERGREGEMARRGIGEKHTSVL